MSTTCALILELGEDAMSDEENKKKAAPTAEHRRTKKPYVRPALRRLGSVRDLTLGGVFSAVRDSRNRPRQTM